MTTLCRTYTSEADAGAAVERLLLAGVAGADISVLMGASARDGREEPHGAFAGVPADAGGAAAGDGADRAAGMGAFAGDAARMRAGAFADADRDTVTSYRGGVAHTRVGGHRGLELVRKRAGLNTPAITSDAGS